MAKQPHNEHELELLLVRLAGSNYPNNEAPLVFSTIDSYGSVFVDELNTGFARSLLIDKSWNDVLS